MNWLMLSDLPAFDEETATPEVWRAAFDAWSKLAMTEKNGPVYEAYTIRLLASWSIDLTELAGVHFGDWQWRVLGANPMVALTWSSSPDTVCKVVANAVFTHDGWLIKHWQGKMIDMGVSEFTQAVRAWARTNSDRWPDAVAAADEFHESMRGRSERNSDSIIQWFLRRTFGITSMMFSPTTASVMSRIAMIESLADISGEAWPDAPWAFLRTTRP